MRARRGHSPGGRNAARGGLRLPSGLLALLGCVLAALVLSAGPALPTAARAPSAAGGKTSRLFHPPPPARPTPGGHLPGEISPLTSHALWGDWHSAVVAPQPPAAVSANTWTNLFPDLYAVSAVSSSDAWAAGEYGHLLHLLGSTWQVVDPANLHGIDLWDIKMLSSSDGWIPAGAQAFEYDRVRWNERSNGLGTAPGLRLGLVAPVAAGNVWGIGRTASRDTVLHWDGSTWTASGPVLADSIALYDIAMLNAGEGWAVGEDELGDAYTPVVLHYDGSTWTRLTGPADGVSLFSVYAVQAGAAWMVGSGAQSGRIYRYTLGDHQWTAWAPPDGSRPWRIYMRSSAEGWASTDGGILHWDGSAWTPEYRVAGKLLQGLGGAGGQVWAVGGLDTIASRGGAGAWLAQRGGPTANDLYAVAVLSPSNAWAVGASGTVLHYTGAAWQAAPTTITANLYAVQMLSATDGVAVGGDLSTGVIARWDGSQWSVVATTPAPLYGLALRGAGSGWAVGDQGVIWQETGGAWRPASSPTTRPLNAVAMDSPAHGWAVGGGFVQDSVQPVLLEYVNGGWVDRSASLPPGAPGLTGVILNADGTEGWAVGNQTGYSPILHLLGGVWTLAPASNVVDLRGVVPEALGEAWAVGCNAYHYVGGSWAAQPFPTNAGYCLNGLALVPGQGGWAVGNAGKILAYNPLAPGQRFYDVPPANPFSAYVGYMAEHAIISGYDDNSFRPFNNITRGQLAKMVVSGMGWPAASPTFPTFADVPPEHPFYSYVETAAAHGVISGYACGGPAEPCDAQNRPYYRPGSDVTRGQLAKIVVSATGWGPLTPPAPPFADVPLSNPFYGYIAQAASKGIISGYTCGTAGEPCPGPYFRSAAPATRGQFSKILYLALTQP